ncbi:MAG TPA: hypothetical protein PKY89_07090 [Deltaproteobacteria bacterium]|nr:hypothetical protein [Deltaproteobacteria bacterium]HPJ93663.1 hypothetical protein [Deltaproteobacteria bacterium]
MISEAMISIIKDNADELTKRLCKDLLSREETKNYRKLNEDLVYERVYDVYSRLDSWLAKDKAKGEILNHYTKLGEKRFKEGIPLTEVVMALMLIKRHLWLYTLEKHFFDTSYEFQQALEFNNRVVLFFDRAIYFTTMGYEKELRKAVEKSGGGFLSRLMGKG